MVWRIVSAIAVLVLILVVPVGVEAQNLLVNPNFDTDASGWSGLGSWDPLDVDGSPSSGSATWLNDWPGSGGSMYFSQCIELVAPIEAFDLRAYIYIPGGQAGTGYASLAAWFYSDSACDDFIWSYGPPPASVLGVWQLAEDTDWAPNNAASVQIGLFNQESGTGDFRVYHDAVYFGPNSTMVFGDGFESSDTSQWSSTTSGQ
ncbi:MAG: hypothetical protein V2I67_15660 [Thermoanaerobaculales bacterium]|jgi:hypothetical protein|nr:hypothetical protein [Thermoanaerobaculales bacterium]